MDEEIDGETICAEVTAEKEAAVIVLAFIEKRAKGRESILTHGTAKNTRAQNLLKCRYNILLISMHFHF